MSIITSSIRNSNGTTYTITTDSASDWAAVAINTYFKDLSDGLIRYKTPTGNIVNAISSSYAISAATASYYAGSVVSASYSQTASYVTPLTQTVTITGSLNISGSTTQIGTNNLLGQTNLSGSIYVSGSMNALANFTLGGTLRLDPAQDPGYTNETASFLFTSASNTEQGYDLYYRQDGNLVKFKWLEGGISSGLLYGGVISASGATIFVSSGSGILLDPNASFSKEINPIFTYVTWPNYSASATYLTSSQNTYLYVDNLGVLHQQTNWFDQTQFEQAIPLGRVTHPNYTTITGIGSNVQTTYDSDSQQSAFIRAFGPLKVDGFSINAHPGTLGFGIGSGVAYTLGGFYSQDPNSPSHYQGNAFATSSIARAYRSGSGVRLDNNGGAFYSTVDPDYWDDGTGVLNTIASGEWQIQRVFTNPITGRTVVYYGQNTYTTLLNALQYLATDPFTEGDFTANSLIFIGYLVLKGQTNNLTDTNNNQIINAGIFRNIAGGSSGGGAVAQTLDELGDVTITTPSNGQALVYSAGIWENGTPSLAQTASYVLQAVSASYAPNTTFPYTGSALITGSLGITGSLSVIDGNGASNLNTDVRTLYGTNSSSSINWAERKLNATNGTARLDWRLLYAFDSATSRSIDWGSRILTDTSQTSSVNWSTRLLTDAGATTAVDWNSRTLRDSSGVGILSVDWRSRLLHDTSTSQSLDWANRQLTTNNGTVILDWRTAQFTGTASYATQALSASWAPGGGGGSPGGSNTYIQFNNAGTFGGEQFFTYSTVSRSIAQGNANSAIGTYSHAKGDSTYAYGYASHTEGRSSTTGNANGYYAIMTASGVFTISSSYGDVSTAGLFDAGYIIGVDDSQYDNTYTYANLIVTSCSFNGTNTIVHVTDTAFNTSRAIIGSISNFGNGGDRVWGGYAAHAQGDTTTALGRYSHAEGGGTAYGQYSHAEGQGNAYGNYSHAEGAGTAYGTYSHAEGQGTAYGNYSHAEGEGSMAGYNGYRMNTDITAGVIKLEPIYGDQTGNFTGGSFVLIFDNSGDIDTVNNSSNTYLYEVSSSVFTSSLTQITLVDNTVTTFTNFNRVRIGDYGNPSPNAADVPLGNASHAEGVSSRTIGEYSHTAGNLTQALGWYQSVVGMSNKPISTLGAFIVGDGDTTGNTRHNLLVAAAGSVTISGSLLMSGSILPAVSGSVTSSFSLGSATNAWKDIWVSNGTINMLDATGSIQTTIKSSPRGVDITGSLHGTVSSIVKGEATVNFGATPGSNYAITTISTPFVTNNSNIHIYIMSTASADHNAMEHQIFSLYGTVMPDNIINNTSFDIVALSQLRLDGTFKVRYTINNN